jgi:pseudaminic acid cytidylyltransferase
LNNICIIPARGGSKRIPGKNTRMFFGKPVIQYAIETARNCGLFEEVMVSTDDSSIKDIALEAGAVVPFMRSTVNANDTATTIAVLLEVLEAYTNNGRSFEYGCCLYPVTPLTTVTQLQSGFERMLSQSYDTVLPIVPFSFPIWRSLQREGNSINWTWPEHALARSQDMPVTYHDAGQWYWFQTEALMSKLALLTDNTGSILLDEMQAQDVDNETDWLMLEQKYLVLNNGLRSKSE